MAYLIALLWRGLTASLDATEFRSPLLVFIVSMLSGGAVGGVSLLIAPYPLFHPSRVHGVSMVISPVLAGLGMSLVGASRQERGKRAVQLESFSYGFAFAFGVALVRFLFAGRM